MTCLEKFKLEHPSVAISIVDEVIYNIICPSDPEYTYMSTNEANALCELRTCEECWNSQIKEETNAK